MEEQIRAQQAKLAALDSRLAAKAQANQQLVEKRREVEAQSAAARQQQEEERTSAMVRQAAQNAARVETAAARKIELLEARCEDSRQDRALRLAAAQQKARQQAAQHHRQVEEVEQRHAELDAQLDAKAAFARQRVELAQRFFTQKLKLKHEQEHAKLLQDQKGLPAMLDGDGQKEDGEPQAEEAAAAAAVAAAARTLDTQREVADRISRPVRPRDKVESGALSRENPHQGHWAWDGATGQMSFYR